MFKKAIFLSLLLFASLSSPVLAAENGSGVIEGQLINGTANGSSVGGIEINLKTFFGGSERSSSTATTDDAGGFVFENLDISPEYSYQANLVYQKAEYFSDTVGFSSDQTSKSIEITVYDSTENPDALSVTRAHTIIDTGPGTLQVTEYYLFLNNSDRTYIGSREINEDGTRETLLFPLPEEIGQMTPGQGLMDCCIYRSEEGFFDTMSFEPGMKQISYTYTIDSHSGDYVLPRMTKYPIADYALLVQGPETKVEAKGLEFWGPMDMEGTSYIHLSGKDMAPDEPLDIVLAGLPRSAASNLVWMILGIAVLGGGAGFAYIRKRKAQPVVLENAPAQTRQDLILEIARLDEDFANGRIKSDQYHHQRDAAKERLNDLKRM